MREETLSGTKSRGSSSALEVLTKEQDGMQTVHTNSTSQSKNSATHRGGLHTHASEAIRTFDPRLVGKFWDEIEPGERMVNFPDKTMIITEEMVNQFADLTHDHNPLHVDLAFAMRSAYRKKISHGALLTALAVGQYHQSFYTYATTLALMTMNTSFFAPAYVGDEVYLEQRVTGKKPATHPKRGMVSYEAWIRRVPDHEPLMYMNFDLLVLRKAGSKGLFRLGLTEEILAKRTFRSDTDPPPPPGLKYPRHEDFAALSSGAAEQPGTSAD